MQKAETKPQVSLTIVLCLLPDGKNRNTSKHFKPSPSCCFANSCEGLDGFLLFFFLFLTFDKKKMHSYILD